MEEIDISDFIKEKKSPDEIPERVKRLAKIYKYGLEERIRISNLMFDTMFLGCDRYDEDGTAYYESYYGERVYFCIVKDTRKIVTTHARDLLELSDEDLALFIESLRDYCLRKQDREIIDCIEEFSSDIGVKIFEYVNKFCLNKGIKTLVPFIDNTKRDLKSSREIVKGCEFNNARAIKILLYNPNTNKPDYIYIDLEFKSILQYLDRLKEKYEYILKIEKMRKK